MVAETKVCVVVTESGCNDWGDKSVDISGVDDEFDDLDADLLEDELDDEDFR
jgi:hypothetical protein